MKPLINILILMALMQLPGIVSGGDTPEERRRAAAAFALSRDQELPPQLLRLIASNGHVSRDCEELEMGFFPQNEWKALKRVFKRNEQTAGILHVIGQYENAREAWENAATRDDQEAKIRDGQFCWWKVELGFGRSLIAILSETGVFTGIQLIEDRQISGLVLQRFDGKNIGDLSYLPPHLKSLEIPTGDLTNFEFHTLPNGLKRFHHPGPAAGSELHVQSLPPRLETFFVRWDEEGGGKDDPLEVHFHLPLPQGLKVDVPRMDGFVYHPEPAEIKQIERYTWRGVEMDARGKVWEVKWDDGSHILVFH